MTQKVTILELVASLGLDFDGKQTSEAGKALGDMRRKIIGVATAWAGLQGVRAVANMVREVAALGDSVDKTSTKLGVGVEELQELRHAGQISGVAVNTLDMGLQRFARRAAEAAVGTGEAKDTLAEMGIELTNADGTLRSVGDLLGDVADNMQNTSDSGLRLKNAFKLFDSEGVVMVNMLRNGRAGLEAMRADARRLGVVMNQSLVTATVAFTDAELQRTQAIQGLRNEIVRGLLPALTRISKRVTTWITQNRKLIAGRVSEWLQRIVGVAVLAGRVLFTVGDAISRLIDIMPTWLRWLVAVGGIIAGLMLILTPFQLALAGLFAGLFLIADDVRAFFAGGRSVTGFVIREFKKLEKDLLRPIDVDDHWTIKLAKKMAQAFRDMGDVLKQLEEDLERFGSSEVLANVFTDAFEFWKGQFRDFISFIQSELSTTTVGRFLETINPLLEVAKEFRTLGGFLPDAFALHPLEFLRPGAQGGAGGGQPLPPVHVEITIEGGVVQPAETAASVREAARRGVSEGLRESISEAYQQGVPGPLPAPVP